MSEKQKNTVILLVSAVLFAIGLFTRGITGTVILGACAVIAGAETFSEAISGVTCGRVTDENFLMTVACVGAFAVGEASEGAAVMVLFRLGESLESLAVERSRRSVTELIDLKTEICHVETDEKIVDTSPDEVKPGDVLIVRAGERIPTDGELISRAATLDMSALTGEVLPVTVQFGEAVLSGSIVSGGAVRIRVTKEYFDSTAQRILETAEKAAERKSAGESFITKFAKVYTPVVMLLALITATVPGIISGEYGTWIHRALSFLVISCPCALVISVPLTFFAAIGGASRRGILVKGASVFDSAARIDTVLFDKTGTLTEGKLTVKKVLPEERKDEILMISASVEKYSTHPISAAICSAYAGDGIEVFSTTEYPGEGIVSETSAGTVTVGKCDLLRRENVPVFDLPNDVGSVVYVGLNGELSGCIILSDNVKKSAVEAVSSLSRQNINCVMLTGDTEDAAREVARRVGLSDYGFSLLPNDKADAVERYRKSGVCAFVGDGINDAAPLISADVGFAMGALGTDAAAEAADVLIADDDLTKILTLISHSKRTLRLARENVIFALAVKTSVLALAAFGIVGMWASVFADVGVSLLAVLNAMRALHVGD